MERPDGLNRPRLLWLSAERLRIGREMNGDLEALLEFVAAISPYTKALEARNAKLEAVKEAAGEGK